MVKNAGADPGAAMLIRSVAAGQLRLRNWPPYCLVFNPVSGSTHLISEEAGEVLAHIDNQGCVSRADLINNFWTPLEAAESAQALDAWLEQFESLGLLETEPQ